MRNPRTKQPTITQAEPGTRPLVELYHVHYDDNGHVIALLHRRLSHGAPWVVSTLYPIPERESFHRTAHEALEAMGVDPSQVLGAGAVSRIGGSKPRS